MTPSHQLELPTERRRLTCLKQQHLCHYYYQYHYHSKMAKPNYSSWLPSITVFILLLLLDNQNLVTLSHSLETNQFYLQQQASSRPNFNINNMSLSGNELPSGSPPEIIDKQQDRIVPVGSNISLECTARGKGLSFVWFQDEKNITTNSSTGPSSLEQVQSTTKLLEEKRYEISEEQSVSEFGVNVTTSVLYLFNLTLTDSSVFLCWVENHAGYKVANFSVTVVTQQPSQSTQFFPLIGIGGKNYISLVFVLVLIIGIVLLLSIKLILSYNQSNLEQRSNSSQSSSSNDLKQQQNLHLRQGSSISSNEEGDQASPNGTNNEYGFIEHMRSGIINMDYHSMSPVIQFNQKSKHQLQQEMQQQQQQHLQQQHLHHQQLSSASLLQHQHHPPMYSESGPIPDLYHPTQAMYTPTPSTIFAGTPALISHHLSGHPHQPQSQQQKPQFIQDMMNQQQQQPTSNHQRNLDYDRFHIL